MIFYVRIYNVHVYDTVDLLKVPVSIQSSGGDIGEGEPGTEEEIAQRTRSKHPLHDVSITSLEAGLGPVEGEDPPVPRELDPDELWWHQWLNSLTSDTPLNGTL